MNLSEGQWSEWYKCLECNNIWKHEWNTDDYSNDYTICTNCGSCDFDEIEEPPLEPIQTIQKGT